MTIYGQSLGYEQAKLGQGRNSDRYCLNQSVVFSSRKCGRHLPGGFSPFCFFAEEIRTTAEPLSPVVQSARRAGAIPLQ
jgi:hypothetical protein